MRTRLTSFDGTESMEVDFVTPEEHRDLVATLNGGGQAIPRGAGLSYCSVGAGPGVRSVSSLLLNRILAFDQESGLVDVEPGLRLGDLYRLTAPRGWYLQVMPGHPSITIGGCIGCNVHGKNQCREGNFIHAVEWLTLLHPDHGEIRCSRHEEPTLFHLTIGGFGLTGFITSVRLRLRRLPGAAVKLRRLPVANLIETIETMEKYGHDAEVLYSWNNLNLSGRNFGSGFVYVGHPDPAATSEEVVFRPLSAEARSRFPLNAYTRLTTRLLLNAYAWSQQLSASDGLISFDRAVFPVVGKEFYFWLFGRKGFREYQLLAPRSRWGEVSETLAGLVRKHSVSITLGSLKLFRGRSGLLHFDGTGVVLTIDVPEGKNGRGLFEDLDHLTISCGGLVNLAKDGRVQASFVRRAFPGYDRFKKELAAFDPKRRFDSSLRRRLDL